MAEFRMPSLGADMEAGTLVEWLVHPGDSVARGDIVAVVETEKSTIEVEVFSDGVVEELLVAPGTRVPVGTVLARLSDGAAPAAPAAMPSTEAPEVAGNGDRGAGQVPSAAPSITSPLVRHLAEAARLLPEQITGSGAGGRVLRSDVERALAHRAEPAGEKSGSPSQQVVAPPVGTRPRVSPRARRRADELGFDAGTVTGTGHTGAVTFEDIERAVGTAAERRPAPKPPPAADAGGREDRSGMRRAIARLMDRSNREIPHFYLAHDVDLGPVLTWLAQENEGRSITERLLPAALLLKAVALAAAETDGVNGYWLDGGYAPADRVDLGLAVSLRTGGLIIPVIADAAARSLDDMMTAMQDLVLRARRGRLRASDLAEGSVTVTNLGDQGVQAVYGVIHPPQVALVGFGTIAERPWTIGGMVGVRPVVTVTLAADHRAVDGRLGSAFLSSIQGHLQQPETL